ncbi:putative Potassium efflux system KefA protein / Small-conductance mechanosensitive channel [Syntrophobacter sp. SbD1]|nr:putative Potassium efflux system KefA protein / Small-conductance mechanosensitive channel [Syntrophobacter sp. SbD1]
MEISSAFLSLKKIWPQVHQYLPNHVLTWAMAAQLAAGGFAFLLAHMAAGAFRSWFERYMALAGLSEESSDRRKTKTFLKVVRPILTVLFLEIVLRLAHHFDWPAEGFETLLFVALALFFVRFLAAPMTNRYWSAILTVAIWLWAIVYAFHAEGIWTNFFTDIYFEHGNVHVSMLTILRASWLLLFLYWLSKNLLIILHLWLQTGSGLPPATQALFYKLCRLLLFSASVVVVLHYMGIDLTVFALFGGAIGLGIGFGLQKIFANLVSGFMILADKSIKPGDVIQLGNTYGWINFLGSRYVSVVTRSGVEHLIPNESLITGEVINWSYSSNLVRLQVPVGISYDSDLETATRLVLEAAGDTMRVLHEPKPACLLTGFGDNAVNLELRVWINDPQNGLGAVRNELLMGIWRRFKTEGIELPYPQRVLHHKSIPEVRIRTEPRTEKAVE